MNNKIKVFFSTILTALLFVSCGLSSIFTSLTFTACAAEKKEQKTIAMYIIAGQSNASGYSPVNQIPVAYKSEHDGGFKNVHYYGRADGRYWTDFNTTVDFGLGRSSEHFGAEVGIAERHTAMCPDQEAIIIKCALGSVYLVDTVNSITSNSGNWCPPTYKDSYKNGDKSGLLYRQLISYVTAAAKHYTDLGYKIDLKGTFWMQGEAETIDSSYTESTGNYKACLKALIGDLRNDYAEILNDESAKKSAFVIGRISPTFQKRVNGDAVDAVKRIQAEVAGEVDGAYITEKDYITYNPDTDTCEGPDTAHFSGKDMIAIGQNVGNLLLTAGKSYVHVSVEGSGKADAPEYVFINSGENKTVTFTSTKDHHSLKTVIYDGVDVTDRLENGTFTVSYEEGGHELFATFVEAAKYQVSVESDISKVTISRTPSQRFYYENDEITFKITVKSGYKLDSVTFNGANVEVENGSCKITVVSGENKLCVKAAEDETGGNPNDSSSESSGSSDSQTSGSSGVNSSNGGGGCSSSSASAEAMASLMLCLGSVVLFKKFVI